jgi:hypothetical protein
MIKIISVKKPATKFHDKCYYCSCCFEYHITDIPEKKWWNIWLGIARTIDCPNCKFKIKHLPDCDLGF